jgi:sulfate transport system permease protein
MYHGDFALESTFDVKFTSAQSGKPTTLAGSPVISAYLDNDLGQLTAGITLTALYAPNGWIGEHLAKHGIQAAYNPLGVFIALTFIGFPFVVRTLQPVMEDLGKEVEEAAATLGAGRWTVFWRVILPMLVPALITGFTLAFARAIGEYGSVVFISGNLPMKTEILPLLIVAQLDSPGHRPRLRST